MTKTFWFLRWLWPSVINQKGLALAHCSRMVYALWMDSQHTNFFRVGVKSPPYKMQFSNLHFEHGLFDPLIVTFQGQTFLIGSNKPCPKWKFENCIFIWWALGTYFVYIQGSNFSADSRNSADFETFETSIGGQWDLCKSTEKLIGGGGEYLKIYWTHRNGSPIKICRNSMKMFSKLYTSVKSTKFGKKWP